MSTPAILNGRQEKVKEAELTVKAELVKAICPSKGGAGGEAVQA